jgi:hypothetical protein
MFNKFSSHFSKIWHKSFKFLHDQTKNYEILWNLMKTIKLLQFNLVKYFDFIQFRCILFSFAFAFNAFGSLPQNFGLI